MRKIQILGVTLFDYSVREALRKVDGYLKDGKVNTISYVTIKGVLEADENPVIKNFVGDLDMTIPADTDILKSADAASRNRLKEIENNEFMDEFLKKLIRMRKSIYLLAETTAQLKKLDSYVKSYQDNLNIVGEFALDQLQADQDFVVNEINITEPSVLISLMTSMARIEFFNANNMKLDVEIFLMLKEDMNLSVKKRNIILALYDYIVKHSFKKKVDKYNSENNSDE